jgi:hypothetical protein
MRSMTPEQTIAEAMYYRQCADGRCDDPERAEMKYTITRHMTSYADLTPDTDSPVVTDVHYRCSVHAPVSPEAEWPGSLRIDVEMLIPTR